MAVKISLATPTVSVPAIYFVLTDGGQFAPYRFSVVFKRLPTSERDAINAQWVKGELPIQELLDRIVTGWDGLTDEAGRPVPYSHAERRAAEEANTGLEQAMVVAWFDHAFVNQRQAAAKNLEAPSVTGSAPTTPTAASSTTSCAPTADSSASTLTG